MLSLLKINHQLDESSSSGKCISCFQIVGYGFYQEWLRPAIFQCPCWPRAKVLSPLCSPKEEGRRGAVHICWGNTSTGSWRTSAFCASPRRANVRRRARRSQTRWATAMIAVSLTRLCSYLDNNFLLVDDTFLTVFVFWSPTYCSWRMWWGLQGQAGGKTPPKN